MTIPEKVFQSTDADDRGTTTGVNSIRERVPQLSVIVVSGALSIAGTSSAAPNRVWEAPYIHESQATASGFISEHVSETVDDAEATRKAISELRRISGLTWEQLGELFNVSRRSVHFWASGKPLNAVNEQRLLKILEVVRTADRGDARSNRAALFEVNRGTTAFDLLTAGKVEEARAILGGGVDRPNPALVELSTDAKVERKPLPPDALVNAQHERVHRDPGHARAARTVRNRRRGTN